MIPFLICLFLGSGLSGLPTNPASDELFEKEIRPLLVQKCQACHGGEKQKAGLRLDSRDAWRTGGDSGPAIVPGQPEKSLLIHAIKGEEGLSRMPPKAKLSDREIALLTQWVKSGAVDPRTGGPTRLGGTTWEDARKWWAFQPLKRPAVPNISTASPIDAFVTQRLHERNLKRSPPADRRTLLRRVTYDLTGLPPTFAEVAAFEQDRSPLAFAKVVERLLASRAYGERWGRHWLDLVRYADTAGENSDHPLPHAWRYRNWVIDAVNRDLPYDEFLREQLAGDIYATERPSEDYASLITATGFLAIARRFDHDSDKSMHLTHEDSIDTLGKAFLGLTIGCARCHDHKYDAITTRDYYALYGIFDSTKLAFPGCEAKQQPRDMVPLVPPSEWSRVTKPYEDKLADLDARLQARRKAESEHASQIQSLIAKSGRRILSGKLADGAEQSFDSLAAVVEIKSGELLQLSITPLKNHGADSTLIEWEITEVGGEGRRWNATEEAVDDLLAGNPHADRLGNKNVWWFVDLRKGLLPLPEPIRSLSGNKGLDVWRNGDTPSAFVNGTNQEVNVWTRLPSRSLFLHPGDTGAVGLAWLSPISGKIKVRGRVRDVHTGGPDGVGWSVDRFAIPARDALVALSQVASERARLEAERNQLVRNAPQQDVAYAAVEGTSADARLHLRGDPERLGEVVPRRWLEVLGGKSIENKSGSGRRDLAGWITARDNPLTARVMVNRIWLHHFGKGLVKTPSDFGTRGLPPSHPELLDWLASEFVDSGWSLKAMHRAILLSDTYQQASDQNEQAAAIDPANEFYWRFDRRRLSAEEIRDSLLNTSGQLAREPAQAHPFPPESSWSYTQHVPFSTFFETDKRSVYLVNVRNRRHPFLGLFDGADPNATTAERQTTTVPTQALYFLNDPFFHQQAEKLAERMLALPDSERVPALFKTILQRHPTQHDTEFASAFLKRYGESLVKLTPAQRTSVSWAALTRILLASNEFLFTE